MTKKDDSKSSDPLHTTVNICNKCIVRFIVVLSNDIFFLTTNVCCLFLSRRQVIIQFTFIYSHAKKGIMTHFNPLKIFMFCIELWCTNPYVYITSIFLTLNSFSYCCFLIVLYIMDTMYNQISERDLIR